MDTSVKIYAHGDVVEGSWLLYARDIGLLQNIEIVSAPLELERDLRSVTLFPKDIGSMVDMVVLGTCETECVSLPFFSYHVLSPSRQHAYLVGQTPRHLG